MQISSDQTKNGFQDQTIDLRNYTGTWRLLGIENGRLNIISSEIVGVPKADGDSTSNGIYTNKYFKLEGKIGYTNAETELNRICSLYGKGKNAEPGTARSLNLEDINKITGYDPAHTGVNINKATEQEILAGDPYGKNELFQYGNRVTYEWDGTSKPKYTSSTKNGQLETHNLSPFNGFSWWNGISFQKSDYIAGKSEKICTLTSDYYYYFPETLTTTTDTNQSIGIANNSPEREMLFNPETDYYWLASRSVSTKNNYAYFNVGCVAGGLVGGTAINGSHGIEQGIAFGLRPVVSLKSDIKLEKDGNGVWQFSE